MISLTFNCTKHLNNFSVPYSPGREDSFALENFKYKLIQEWLNIDETLPGMDIDSMPREAIDNLLADNKLETFSEQQVIYSHDKKLKIYGIQTESCGAHCNPNYYSWIQFEGQKRIVRVAGFSTVDSIFKLPGSQYLIMQSAWYDRGVVKAADVISLSSDTMSIQRIKYKNEDWLKIFQQAGFITDETFAPYIKYSKKDKILSYAYREFASVNNSTTDSLIEGNYKYIRGSFIFQDEKIFLVNSYKMYCTTSSKADGQTENR